MAFYTNQSRHSAVVTMKINNAQDLKAAVKIGVEEVQSLKDVKLGYNDVVVQAGESIELLDGTDATFVSVRSGE